MNHQAESILPIPLVIVDAIGSAIFALGLANYLGGVDLLPEGMRWENYGAGLMALGLGMAVPASALIFARVLKAAKSRGQRL